MGPYQGSPGSTKVSPYPLVKITTKINTAYAPFKNYSLEEA